MSEYEATRQKKGKQEEEKIEEKSKLHSKCRWIIKFNRARYLGWLLVELLAQLLLR